MKRQAFNPYLPSWEYVPDGEPHLFNGRLYIYGSHDRFGGSTYCMESYVCWSAPSDDLSDWTYHGVIYTGEEDSLNETGKRLMFAPDVAEHKGRYYLYYGLDSSVAISVAVSDRPEGPYTFYGHVHHKNGEILGLCAGDAQQFDPGVFKDDDGQIYLYSGFSTTPDVAERIRKKMKALGKKAPAVNISTEGNWVMTLEDDMVTLRTEPKRLLPGVANSRGTGFEGHEFFEASSMRKLKGKYYAVYSSVRGHELCYATSDYPDRDFVYGGILHSNGNIGISEKPQYYYANNHGSLIEINGSYYVFGHRHTNYTQYQRQGVAERLTMKADGGFAQAEMTSCGLNGGPLAGRGEYPAWISCVLQSGEGACKADVSIDRKIHPAVTQDEKKEAFITNIREGAVAGYKYFELRGLRSVTVWLRGNASGTLAVRTYPGGPDLAVISIDASESWRDFTADAKAEDGVQALYFVYHGSGALDFKSFTLE